MSRIRRITITKFQFPLRNIGPAENGFDNVYRANYDGKGTQQVVTIETDDGVRGEYMGGTDLMIAQLRYLAPRMIGADAFNREFFYDEFNRALRKYDRMGIGPLDIALWDWAGKKLQCSIAQLLGSHKKRIKAYASTYHGDREGGLSTPEDFARFAEHCYELGYRAFKMHGWIDGNVEEEEAAILLLGERVGDRMDLMYDSACHLRTFADALRIGRACDQANFYWYEDPYRDTGISQQGHAKLRELIKTPLLQGEHVRGLEAKSDWVASGATDFVRANPDYDSGITGTLKIAHMAEAAGLDIEIHSGGPAHRHCVATFRNANYYELGLVGPDCDSNRPKVYSCDYSDALEAIGSDGCVPVPQGLGLGVIYDWDKIQHNKVEEYIIE